ncbi:hypothetical protein OB955_24480 [Halobacteria archaeon AArc-m2/3/4]|uniref:Uncharacterized protein n=1 Tax=Natronoglomus mannanivorans TaxID=2979990 RepID=A0ABT2QLU9_9EURY|nr:hypothetical protein [Halobacteria archaeon AArc-m2/3/4]
MSTLSLGDESLRHVLRQIRDQVDGPIEPTYIEQVDELNFELFVSRFGSLAQACLEAGCEYVVKNPDPTVYTAGADDAQQRERLIGDLVRIVTHLGHSPSIKNLNSYGRQSYDETISSFGSWTAVILEAGIDLADVPNYVSPTDVIEELERLTDELDTPPSHEFATAHGAINTEIYDTRFPSWEVALRSAELDPNRIDTTRELITELELLAAALGHRPNETEIEHYTETRVRTFSNEFGSVSNALEAADVPSERDLSPSGSLTDPVDGNTTIPSHTELLRDVFTVKRRHSIEWDNHDQLREAFEYRGILDEKHYDAQFGSIFDTFEFASQLDPREYRSPRNDRIGEVPPEILGDHACELAEILGRRPLIDEVVALTDHSLEQYLDSFESWETVFEQDVEDADSDTITAVSPTNREILEDIERVGASIGRPPTVEDFRESGYLPVESALRRFGSWTTALRMVGVEVDQGIPAEYFAPELTRKTISRANHLCEERFDHESVLVDDVYRMAFDLGHVPDRDEIRKFGVWPSEMYEVVLENDGVLDLSSTVTEVGADHLQAGRERSQLVSDLESVAEVVDGRVWPRDVALFGRYTIPSYVAIFETLEDAFIAAELDTDHFPQQIDSWSGVWEETFADARSFLAALQAYFEESGEAPTMSATRETGTNPQECYEYYDSWTEALKLAGIPPKQRKQRQSGDKTALRESLRELADELGYVPKTTDVDQHGEYGLSTYYRHYSSWQSALEDAELVETAASSAKSDDTAESLPHSEAELEDSSLLDQIVDEFEEIGGEDT